MTDAISNRNDRDLQQLHATGCDELSSGQVMAKIAGDAGVQKMAIRGDDKSYDELIEEYKSVRENKPATVETGAHAIEVGGDVIGIHVLEAGVIGTGAAVLLPVVGLGAGASELRETNVRGQELSRAAAKDEEHVALLTHLELPASFKQSELAKYSHAGKEAQSGAQKMTTMMASVDRPLVRALQLQCDRGMNAAVAMDREGVSKQAFFADHPTVAERYDSDAAFRAGFDAVTNTPKGSSEYTTLRAGLELRDDSYRLANIAVRG
jgi:hypothetical protein